MSLRDDYYKHCATCFNYGLLNRADYTKEGFKCHYYKRIYPLNEGCSHFSWNRNVKDNDINTALKMIDEKKSSWWYVTSAVCDILGYPEENYFLNTLSKIRDNYLLQHLDKMWILVKYDMIGRSLAKALYEAKENKDICQFLVQKYFINICLLIDEDKYEEACTLYFEMVNYLQKKLMTPNNYLFNIENDNYGRRRRIKY